MASVVIDISDDDEVDLKGAGPQKYDTRRKYKRRRRAPLIRVLPKLVRIAGTEVYQHVYLKESLDSLSISLLTDDEDVDGSEASDEDTAGNALPGNRRPVKNSTHRSREPCYPTKHDPLIHRTLQTRRVLCKASPQRNKGGDVSIILNGNEPNSEEEVFVVDLVDPLSTDAPPPANSPHDLIGEVGSVNCEPTDGTSRKMFLSNKNKGVGSVKSEDMDDGLSDVDVLEIDEEPLVCNSPCPTQRVAQVQDRNDPPEDRRGSPAEGCPKRPLCKLEGIPESSRIKLKSNCEDNLADSSALLKDEPPVRRSPRLVALEKRKAQENKYQSKLSKIDKEKCSSAKEGHQTAKEKSSFENEEMTIEEERKKIDEAVAVLKTMCRNEPCCENVQILVRIVPTDASSQVPECTSNSEINVQKCPDNPPLGFEKDQSNNNGASADDEIETDDEDLLVIVDDQADESACEAVPNKENCENSQENSEVQSKANKASNDRDSNGKSSKVTMSSKEVQTEFNSDEPDDVLEVECDPVKCLDSTKPKSVGSRRGSDGILTKKINARCQKPFACEICPRRFSWKTHLMSHLHKHITGKIKHDYHTCEHCGFETAHSKQMEQHKQNCEIVVLKCPECPETFALELDLINHKKVHAKDQCIYCFKTFASHNAVELHKKVHMYETFPYHCEFCLQTFQFKSERERHTVEYHPSANPYICEVCGIAFALRGSLTLHQYKDHNKIYDCEVCAKKFSINGLLAAHYAHNHQVYIFQCNHCLDVFVSRENLVKHLSNAHMDSSLEDESSLSLMYVCPMCEIKFAESEGLLEHLKDHPEVIQMN